MWWWNSGAKDDIQKKKEAYKEMTKNHTEETKNEYRRLKKAAEKAIARAMKEEAVRKINELGRNPNNVFKLDRKVKIDSTDVVGGRCMQESDGILYLIEKDRAKLWKAHMSTIMNDENEWDQIAVADTVEGQTAKVMREKIMEAFKYLKIGKAPGPTEVYTEIILVS